MLRSATALLWLVASAAMPALGSETCPGIEGRTLAGSYYLGDGTGLNWSLELRPEGTFQFDWDGCLGNYDHKSGDWCVENGTIILEVLERRPDPGMMARLATRYTPVAWSDRIYLIPESDLIEFCNAVNDGGEPRDDAWGSYFVREDEWYLPASGMPDVPRSVREYLLPEPVRGTLVTRLTEKTGVVDRGSVDGLRPGMILHLQRDYDLVHYTVLTVSEWSCEVELDELSDTEEIVEGAVSTLLWDESMHPPPPRIAP